MQYGSKLGVIDESTTKQMEQEASEQFEILLMVYLKLQDTFLHRF